MIVKRKFVAVINGKEKTFPVGSKPTPKQIKELGLRNKPELVTTEKK